MNIVMVSTREVRVPPSAQLAITADESAVFSDDIKVKLTARLSPNTPLKGHQLDAGPPAILLSIHIMPNND